TTIDRELRCSADETFLDGTQLWLGTTSNHDQDFVISRYSDPGLGEFEGPHGIVIESFYNENMLEGPDQGYIKLNPNTFGMLYVGGDITAGNILQDFVFARPDDTTTTDGHQAAATTFVATNASQLGGTFNILGGSGTMGGLVRIDAGESTGQDADSNPYDNANVVIGDAIASHVLISKDDAITEINSPLIVHGEYITVGRESGTAWELNRPTQTGVASSTTIRGQEGTDIGGSVHILPGCQTGSNPELCSYVEIGDSSSYTVTHGDIVLDGQNLTLGLGEDTYTISMENLSSTTGLVDNGSTLIIEGQESVSTGGDIDIIAGGSTALSSGVGGTVTVDGGGGNTAGDVVIGANSFSVELSQSGQDTFVKGDLVAEETLHVNDIDGDGDVLVIDTDASTLTLGPDTDAVIVGNVNQGDSSAAAYSLWVRGSLSVGGEAGRDWTLTRPTAQSDGVLTSLVGQPAGATNVGGDLRLIGGTGGNGAGAVHVDAGDAAGGAANVYVGGVETDQVHISHSSGETHVLSPLFVHEYMYSNSTMPLRISAAAGETTYVADSAASGTLELSRSTATTTVRGLLTVDEELRAKSSSTYLEGSLLELGLVASSTDDFVIAMPTSDYGADPTTLGALVLQGYHNTNSGQGDVYINPEPTSETDPNDHGFLRVHGPTEFKGDILAGINEQDFK
ncbi:hypothetical protein KIPB_012137, partial [Kipferlia bialata]